MTYTNYKPKGCIRVKTTNGNTITCESLARAEVLCTMYEMGEVLPKSLVKVELKK